MSFQEHTISTADGLNLFVRDYAPVGEVRGLPVLCLHGLTRNSADFEGIGPRIAKLGRRVIAPDVRGRGRSDYDPKPERYQAGAYAQDTLRILDALGIDRAVFLGTSMGGIMTMLIASFAPTRIAASILNDIGPVLDPRGLARIGTYLGKSGAFESWDALIENIKAGQGAAFPDADDAFWQIFARRVAKQLPNGHIAFAYDPAIATTFVLPSDAPVPSLSPFFTALAAKPVLSLRGALSDLLSPEGVDAMREIKPDLAYAEVPRVGHAPTLDELAAWNAIEKFLLNND
ncbi:MAG TPA: alpha/beta hydrolase [Rhizomicrobium sp.]|jgi:pimeloyl-ACP methyl ester carboxylesterase